MRRTLVTGTLALAIALGINVPRQSLAGDKEWATAGKILAGITALHFLTDGFHSEVHAPHQTVVQHRTVTPHHTAVRHRTVTTHRPPVRHHYGRRSCGTRPRDRGPVIRYQGNNRRVWQPRIHGHPAKLQVWSDYSRRWITIRQHPSIW